MGWAPSALGVRVSAGPLYGVGQCVKSGPDLWKVFSIAASGATWFYGVGQVNPVSGDIAPVMVYFYEVQIDHVATCPGGVPPPPPNPPTPRLFANGSCVTVRGAVTPVVWTVTNAEWLGTAWRYFLQVGSNPPMSKMESEIQAAACPPGSGSTTGHIPTWAVFAGAAILGVFAFTLLPRGRKISD